MCREDTSSPLVGTLQVRLMLVHGQLSDYRLSNLIVYSFYKNMCFAAVLFSFQVCSQIDMRRMPSSCWLRS